MQLDVSVPDYLYGDFSMFLENMTSYEDPEHPELLRNYLANLFEQLKKMPLLFNGMVDQLAMAISTKVRIDSENLAKVLLGDEPSWQQVKPFVAVHGDARACISEIMAHAEQDLKTAILLIHFYKDYDSTPLKAEAEEYAQVDTYQGQDDDENY
jgi:hypothetical protein